ncbi:MAG: gamma-glutamylcyclotransferase [Leptolyngbya sp. RL_3_1]|nr:gamma-glutamylcyclotransferase [Leptolyngbya sp. RL_3_1]
MVEINAVFVYGTLKPGEAYYQKYCQPYVQQAIPAQVQGCLYHLPQGYPALTQGENWVQGSLLKLLPDTDLSIIDQFEGYDPAQPASQNEYQRLTRPVYSLAEACLGQAWAYVMADFRVALYGGILIPEGYWSRTLWTSISPLALMPPCPRNRVETDAIRLGQGCCSQGWWGLGDFRADLDRHLIGLRPQH